MKDIYLKRYLFDTIRKNNLHLPIIFIIF